MAVFARFVVSGLCLFNSYILKTYVILVKSRENKFTYNVERFNSVGNALVLGSSYTDLMMVGVILDVM